MMSEEISSEKYIIGSIIKDYPLVKRIANKLGLETHHFETSTSKTIWTTAEQLSSKGIDIDVVSLIEGLEKSNSIDIDSTSQLLMNSMSLVGNTDNINFHIENIMEKSFRKTAKNILLKGMKQLEYGENVENTAASI